MTHNSVAGRLNPYFNNVNADVKQVTHNCFRKLVDMRKIKHLAPGLLLTTKNISAQENDEYSRKELIRTFND